jgi:hypothetical protein
VALALLPGDPIDDEILAQPVLGGEGLAIIAPPEAPALGPVRMGPPYFHAPNRVYGPRRDRVDDDVQRCEVGYSMEDEDQVRDLYQGIEFIGGPPAEIDDEGTAEDEAYARDLALRVVRTVRPLLYRGPYNNRVALPDDVRQRTEYPRFENLVVDETLAEALTGPPGNLYGEGMDNQPGEEIMSLAVYADAVRTSQGGVCAKIAALSLSVLSRDAEPGTVACKIFHNRDHEFVVVRYGNSRWYVVDPWVHYSFVLPWQRCYFEQAGTVNHVRLSVYSAVEVPFGVVLNQPVIQATTLRMRVAAGVPAPQDRSFPGGHAWGQRHNIHGVANAAPVDEIMAARSDEVVFAADNLTWGAGV